MSTILIEQNQQDHSWQVWIGLEGDGDPSKEGIGFIIGMGATRDEAVTQAVADLEAVVERLQQPEETSV